MSDLLLFCVVAENKKVEDWLNTIEKHLKVWYNEFRKAVIAVAKQTKNIITRDWVVKELQFYNTADIRSILLLLIPITALFLPATVGAVNAILTSVKIVWLSAVLGILVGGLMSSPIWLLLFSLKKSLAEKKMLNHGDFEIVTREMMYKSEELVRRRIVENLHFKDFNKISVGHTAYQLAAAGDEYYIVHYKGSKTVKLFYSTKMYDYKDLEKQA